MDPISILIWIALGAVAGIIAKYILPGKAPGGIIVTILLGIAGAFVGGWVAGLAGIGSQTGGFNIVSVITAVVGALILLVVWGFVAKTMSK